MQRRTEPEPLAAAIGARIRALREAQGLRLEQLAFESGMTSKGHLSDLEHGRVNPTVTTLRAVAARLGVTLVDLVNVDDPSVRALLIERSRDVSDDTLRRWIAEVESTPPVARPPVESSARGPKLAIVHAERAPRGSVPVLELAATGGAFGPSRAAESRGWIRLDPRSRALPGAFVARVHGDSMAPRVPDGAWCLFRRPAPGNRRGRVFLVEERGPGAPEDGGSYSLKLVDTAEVRGRPLVTLRAINPAHPARTLDPTRVDLRIVAELVRVLPLPSE